MNDPHPVEAIRSRVLYFRTTGKDTQMNAIRSTLAQWSMVDVVPSRTARRAIGVAVFAVATALSSHVALPIPGTPVPFTFGPLLVLLSGALLGARLGASSQLLYVGMGVAGLPVFAAGGGVLYLLGPTGGYLLAYPVAAFVTGALMGRGLPRTLGALLVGLAVIYAGGVSWLAILGAGVGAVALGLTPFLVADLVKVGLAAIVANRLRGRAVELFLR